LSPDASDSKKHQGSGSPEDGGKFIVLSEKLFVINEASVDVCSCCNQPCDGDGIKSQALQWDLCECWFHTLCENIISI